MKKQILVLTAFGITIAVQAQNVMVIEMNDNVVHKVNVDDIRHITFCNSEDEHSCPIAEAIDLGLPSGTKWASWNVGASKPEDNGGYYAWGETEEKDVYDWSTYIHCDGTWETCHYIGDYIAGTEYDVAHVKWGGTWCMPSTLQMMELNIYCTHKWTMQNGVNGTLITGPNGASIFLPAAGERIAGELISDGEYGWYWSSKFAQEGSEARAHILLFYSSGWLLGSHSYRYFGLPVRPVCK